MDQGPGWYGDHPDQAIIQGGQCQKQFSGGSLAIECNVNNTALTGFSGVRGAINSTSRLIFNFNGAVGSDMCLIVLGDDLNSQDDDLLVTVDDVAGAFYILDQEATALNESLNIFPSQVYLARVPVSVNLYQSHVIEVVTTGWNPKTPQAGGGLLYATLDGKHALAGVARSRIGLAAYGPAFGIGWSIINFASNGESVSQFKVTTP